MTDSIGKTYLNISEEEWNKLVEKAIEIWENLRDVKKDPENTWESNECPMHPNNFFYLSQVVGFNNLNGYNYEEYIDKWRIRRKS